MGRLFRLWRRPAPPRPETPAESPRSRLERTLAYTFTRPELLEAALTHPSAATGTEVHYERLEFLGDAVLDLAIADLLMRQFPAAKEGPLSKLRASIVNARTLALKAQSIDLGDMIRFGKGEEKSGGREKISILAAAFEAVLGAIYTDSGLGPAQQVVERMFKDDIGGPAAERDYKTELQEIAYRRFRSQPVYELVSASGPDHAKRFTSKIRIGSRDLGMGEGGSKKQSEQAAAREALERLALEDRERTA
ncbi:MAG TPA: ribonuclease III [Candidatus Binataceae bacterium]|nr:ribonuclease III [Candidatus Binataceae bacterium]